MVFLQYYGASNDLLHTNPRVRQRAGNHTVCTCGGAQLLCACYTSASTSVLRVCTYSRYYSRYGEKQEKVQHQISLSLTLSQINDHTCRDNMTIVQTGLTFNVTVPLNQERWGHAAGEILETRWPATAPHRRQGAGNGAHLSSLPAPDSTAPV